MRLVEKFSRARVRTVQFSSSGEDLENVVQKNLVCPGREKYDILTIAAPTVDITNLKINNCSSVELEKKVTESCNNVIVVAKNALKEHKDLKRVIILDHPPRFDEKVKTEMAIFANNIFNSVIQSLPKNINIAFGKHNLSSYGVGKTYDSRYKSTCLNRTDGLHFVGPSGMKDYSSSLINILTTALRTSGNTHSPVSDSISPIQVSNRFDCLNQGN